MSKKHNLKTASITLCFIILFGFSISLQTTTAATATKDVTAQVVLLGNPFNKATFAKNVWDMQVYDRRIYLGHGDYDNNAGPIPVIYYDSNTNEFKTQYSVDEEQIDRYKVLNNKLYIPGTDANESWDYGNFYVLDNDQWTKFRTIPKANHVFDMAYFNGRLYAVTGTTSKGWGELLMSKDLGKTWISQVPQTNKAFTTLGDWTTTLFEMDNKLYATGNMTYPSEEDDNLFAKYRNMLVIDGKSTFVQAYDGRFFPGASTKYLYRMLRTTSVNNYLVYLNVSIGQAQWSPRSMYAASSLTQARLITFPSAVALPTDILVRDNTTYVLAYVMNSSSSYTNIVYKSTDLQNWTELYHFNTDTFARSFEELNGDFYFGLGCGMYDLKASTGNILKVTSNTY